MPRLDELVRSRHHGRDSAVLEAGRHEPVRRLLEHAHLHSRASSTSRKCRGGLPVSSSTAFDTVASWPSQLARPKEAMNCATGSGRPAYSTRMPTKVSSSTATASTGVPLSSLASAARSAPESLRARDVVGPVCVSVFAEDDGCRRRAIGARDIGRLAVAAVVDVPACRDRLRQALRREISIDAVPEHRPLEPTCQERLLCPSVLGRCGGRVRLGRVDDPGVGDPPYPGVLRRRYCRGVLCHTSPDVSTADQEQPVDAAVCLAQTFRIVEVALPHVRALRGVRVQLTRISGHEHEFTRLDSLEQKVGGRPAELSGRTADSDRHLCSPSSGRQLDCAAIIRSHSSNSPSVEFLRQALRLTPRLRVPRRPALRPPTYRPRVASWRAAPPRRGLRAWPIGSWGGPGAGRRPGRSRSRYRP